MFFSFPIPIYLIGFIGFILCFTLYFYSSLLSTDFSVKGNRLFLSHMIGIAYIKSFCIKLTGCLYLAVTVRVSKFHSNQYNHNDTAFNTYYFINLQNPKTVTAFFLLFQKIRFYDLCLRTPVSHPDKQAAYSSEAVSIYDDPVVL